MLIKLLNRLLRKYMWMYERERGDRGIVIAKNYEDALKQLSKEYPDTRRRVKETEDADNNIRYVSGSLYMYVVDMEHVEIKGNVFITEPY